MDLFFNGMLSEPGPKFRTAGLIVTDINISFYFYFIEIYKYFNSYSHL